MNRRQSSRAARRNVVIKITQNFFSDIATHSNVLQQGCSVELCQWVCANIRNITDSDRIFCWRYAAEAYGPSRRSIQVHYSSLPEESKYLSRWIQQVHDCWRYYRFRACFTEHPWVNNVVYAMSATQAVQ